MLTRLAVTTCHFLLVPTTLLEQYVRFINNGCIGHITIALRYILTDNIYNNKKQIYLQVSIFSVEKEMHISILPTNDGSQIRHDFRHLR